MEVTNRELDLMQRISQAEIPEDGPLASWVVTYLTEGRYLTADEFAMMRTLLEKLPQKKEGNP